jgi:hypothetical protein
MSADPDTALHCGFYGFATVLCVDWQPLWHTPSTFAVAGHEGDMTTNAEDPRTPHTTQHQRNANAHVEYTAPPYWRVLCRARRCLALISHWQVEGHDGLGHAVVGGVEGGCDLEGTAGGGIGAAWEGESAGTNTNTDTNPTQHNANMTRHEMTH